MFFDIHRTDYSVKMMFLASNQALKLGWFSRGRLRWGRASKAGRGVAARSWGLGSARENRAGRNPPHIVSGLSCGTPAIVCFRLPEVSGPQLATVGVRRGGWVQGTPPHGINRDLMVSAPTRGPPPGHAPVPGQSNRTSYTIASVWCRHSPLAPGSARFLLGRGINLHPIHILNQPRTRPGTGPGRAGQKRAG